MDKEQIIQMARDAGFGNLVGMPYIEAMQRFALLVRAATKEEDAKICENMANEKEATPEQEFALDLASDAIRASK